jgi:hypothetical protein
MTQTSTAALALIETLPTPALDALRGEPKPQKIRHHPPPPLGGGHFWTLVILQVDDNKYLTKSTY